MEHRICLHLIFHLDLTRADTESGNTIYDLVSEGIDYLDTRTEFWRQQKPMYARKREKSDIGKQGRKDGKKPVDPTKYILKNLEEIDAGIEQNFSFNLLFNLNFILKQGNMFIAPDTLAVEYLKFLIDQFTELTNGGQI